MNPEATVFVVDDDPSIRRALQRLIESVGLRAEVYGTAQDFLSAYDSSKAGCLVLDVRMPGLSGLDLQKTLASRKIDVPVVFITGHADVHMSVGAMKAGALDFIEKPFKEQVLLDAIFSAIDRDAQIRSQKSTRSRIEDRLAMLTPREREVLTHVVVGKLNKEVAAEMGISEKTIKVHRARVMKKMQAESLAELVLLAQSAGICGNGEQMKPEIRKPSGSELMAARG